MKEEFLAALEKKSWTYPTPFIKRTMWDQYEDSVERIALFGYRFDSNDPNELGKVVVDALARSLDAKDERDCLEVRDILENGYIYQEVGMEEFQDWAKHDVSRYFSSFFYRIEMARKIWILKNKPFGKDCLFQNFDKTVTFLTWCKED